MKMRSLTRQLIGMVLVAELLCAILFSTVSILHEMHGRRRALDVILRGRADSLLGAVQDTDDPEANVTVDQNELVLPAEDIYEVFSPTNRPLGRSPNPDAQMLEPFPATDRHGYFNMVANGVHYRVLRTEGVRVIDRVENGGVRRPVVLLYGIPTARLMHEVFEAGRFYILTSALLLAATGVLLAWLLRRSLSPLRGLAFSASRVSASSWEFAPSDAVLQIRELEPIASSIRQLVHGLQLAFERQRRFTGDAAHELKTSLALLKSSLQLLTLQHRTAEQYEAGLEELAFDVERMEQLTERMLTLARLEEEPAAASDVIDLATVARATADRLRGFAATKQITIRISIEDSGLVRLQPSDAEVLCSNLLLNAVQHSPSNETVEVSIGQGGGTVHMRISNLGDAIPEAALPHLFERFYRVDTSRSRQSGGTGLGLAICKAIVERSQGMIEITSKSGEGTEVAVSFPEAV